jgi:putative redox protein
VLGAWAHTYVADRVQAEPPARDGFQAAARTARTRFRTEIAAEHHALTADEPRDLGGADAGPTPYDLLASALAACKTMTLRMYADRKEWPLEAVTARVQHAKIHAADCDDCATEKGKIDRFTVELDLTGADLTDAQRARLHEIAARCPVHRTLQGEVDIPSSLRDA